MKRFILVALLALSFVIPAFAAGDVDNPQNNATNLTTGTLPAARMPALTGDCTTSAGAVATTCTSINGVNQTSAWSTAAPTPTCANAGAITTQTTSVRSKTLGKTVFIEGNVNITSLGTCGGASITVPITGTAASGTPLVGYNANSGGSFPAIINSGATSVTLIFTPAANSYFFAGVYEQQ